MEAATTHLLAALYALAHGLALTGEDGAEVERHGDGLRPELWRETKRLLREADRDPDGTTLDLRFLPLVLRWLGVASEDAFAAEFGGGAAEAIARDCGRLPRQSRVPNHRHRRGEVRQAFGSLRAVQGGRPRPRGLVQEPLAAVRLRGPGAVEVAR